MLCPRFLAVRSIRLLKHLDGASWPEIYVQRNVRAFTTAAPSTAAPQHQVPVLKRFWKRVNIEESNDLADKLTIMLDKRVLKTPGGHPISIPASKRVLASIAAQEWEAQDKVTKHYALPVTSLICKALDVYEDEGARIDKCADLLRYLDTDTICFQEEYPPQLASLQKTHWDPLFHWVRKEFGVPLEVYSAIMRPYQPEETREALSKVLHGMNALTLAGMERAVYYSKSFIIALAMAKQRLNAEQAAQAALVEVQSQIQRWGEVEDTHDVDYRDMRRQLASAALVFSEV